jgi:hypothetical protein
VQSSFCTTAVTESEAVFQAERRISGLTGPERKSQTAPLPAREFVVSKKGLS